MMESSYVNPFISESLSSVSVVSVPSVVQNLFFSFYHGDHGGHVAASLRSAATKRDREL